jgi:hypothetical protein
MRVKLPILPLAAASVGGLIVAGLLLGPWAAPVSAQLNRISPNLQVAMPQNQTPAPQPIAIGGLDRERFVVATREPRLVQQIGRDGTAQTMLLTVVTYYVLNGDRLENVEHVRVPAGFRLVMLDE